MVWFGEELPRDALARAWQASEQADVVLSVGTSALVQPAASLPVAALRNGAALIEINPAPTPLSALAHQCVRHPAGVALPAIVTQLKSVAA